jgi:O-antigen/teichoic acid export membrane protein
MARPVAGQLCALGRAVNRAAGPSEEGVRPGAWGGARSLMGRKVVRDLAITFGTRWVQIVIALVGSVLSARALGPESFGRFGLIMASVMVLGTVADAGLTYAATKLIAQHNEEDAEKARSVAGAYFRSRLLAGSLGGVAGVLLAWPLALLLGYSEMTPLLQLASCTLFALAISSYPTTILVALERFDLLGAAGVANAVITLAGIVALFVAGQLNLFTLLLWNVVLPLLSTLPAWLMLPRAWLPWRLSRRSSGERGELLRFSRWIALSNVGTIIAVQGDVLLLGRLGTPADVGVYSVVLALALRLDSLNQSLLLVLLPRASRLRDPEEIGRYRGQVWRGSLVLAGVLGVVALSAQPLILLLYGESYRASAGLFLALMLVVLFDLVTSSLMLLAFPLERPRVLAAADWLRVAVLGLAGWFLIPRLGGYGAVVARGASRVVGTAYALLALRSAGAEGLRLDMAPRDDSQPRAGL